MEVDKDDIIFISLASGNNESIYLGVSSWFVVIQVRLLDL